MPRAGYSSRPALPRIGPGLIEVHGLTKRFRGRPAIAGLTFAVPRGQVVGLLGRPGAGRTTTLRLLAGVLDPTSGDVRIAGRDVRSRATRRRLGFLPEGDPVDGDARLHAYLDTMCRLRGVPPSRRRDLVDRALAACGLEEHRVDLVGDLPPGLLRRVGLAQAVVHDPEVLILDEPAAGLGAAEAGEVLEIVGRSAPGGRSCGRAARSATSRRAIACWCSGRAGWPPTTARRACGSAWPRAQAGRCWPWCAATRPAWLDACAVWRA